MFGWSCAPHNFIDERVEMFRVGRKQNVDARYFGCDANFVWEFSIHQLRKEKKRQNMREIDHRTWISWAVNVENTGGVVFVLFRLAAIRRKYGS